MRKTIVVEFPDGFEFPAVADAQDTQSKCYKCPLMATDDGYEYCFVTDESNAICPFYDGADAVTLTRDM